MTIREFRSNLSKYLKLMQEGGMLTINGAEYAYVGKASQDRVYTQKKSNLLKKAKRAKGEAKSVYTEPLTPSTSQEPVYTVECEKCGIPATHTKWEDGEERAICLECIKKTVPEKLLKSFLMTCEKL